jgi:hypothetical protein
MAHTIHEALPVESKDQADGSEPEERGRTEHQTAEE